MNVKKLLNSLNVKYQCRNYGLSLRQCPQFLFLVMGIVIIFSSIFYYLIASYFSSDLTIVVLGDFAITAVLFIISYIITRNSEKLAEVSRMKSEFVNIVTHQLRSPITNLKWIIEFLTAKDFEGDAVRQEEYYSNLKENVRRMVELTDTLIFVSKIEQGSVPFSKKEVSLVDIIKQIISEFSIFATASNVKIEFYPQENLPTVFTDPSQIKIVIETLVDNAIKYIKGGGVVEIKLEKKDKKIYFEIKDNGVGIPKKDQRFIFNKFFRSENILREQTRGSGLGLYIAKSIIERSRGQIGFSSEEGKGSTFWFSLPI
jgi:signal transduction histidine kinase